jgi:hypothetical protein
MHAGAQISLGFGENRIGEVFAGRTRLSPSA